MHIHRVTGGWRYLLWLLAIHLDWLVDQSLAVRGLEDLLTILDLDNLLTSPHLGHGQNLDLLGPEVLTSLDLHLTSRVLHVLDNDLLAIGGVDHLLALARGNHLVSTHN